MKLLYLFHIFEHMFKIIYNNSFNIEFNCYVVIKFRVTELKKEHIGQIQFYNIILFIIISCGLIISKRVFIYNILDVIYRYFC
jgi:hypothetical protein